MKTGVSIRLRWAIFLALSLLALAIRLPQLGARPMHTDEAINAYLTGELLAGESFHYESKDRHGPALYALAEPWAKGLGARQFSDLTESQLRRLPVLIGCFTILMLGAGVEMFGFIPCLVAAILFAVAPIPVYYSRYFIHETLFVAATLGLILSGWRAWHHQSLVAAALAGLCAALMLTSKETAVIHFFALGVVVVCAGGLPPRAKLPPLKVMAVVVGVAVLVSVALFTWFGRNGAVFIELAHAVSRFAGRAGGEGHEKPFGYYFTLLDPMWVLFIVAIGGVYAAIWEATHQTGKAPVLLVIYGGVVFLVYSAIPYKTPWLALNLWLPLALACGLGVAAFWEQLPSRGGRWGLGVAGLFLVMALGVQTRILAFDQPADEKNPLAYAHTGEDLAGLPQRLETLARERNQPAPCIAVVAADAWPLPWYLRKFAQTGYWQPGQDPGTADYYITTTDVPDALAARFQAFRPEFFGVRPGVLIELWIPPMERRRP